MARRRPEASLRPVDLARAVGLGAESVRRYEEAGFLPPARRLPSGQRRYTGRHLQALETARAMQAGYGWFPALQVMRHVHHGDLTAALALVDARHADLHDRRRQVAETLDALRGSLAASPPAEGRPMIRRRPVSIGEAARAVGQRPSALRYWEERGLLSPIRQRGSGYRLYDEEQMRRVRLVALLRAGKYDFDRIAFVLQEIGADRPERAVAAVERRLVELAEQSRRCSAATAALWSYLEQCMAAPTP